MSSTLRLVMNANCSTVARLFAERLSSSNFLSRPIDTGSFSKALLAKNSSLRFSSLYISSGSFLKRLYDKFNDCSKTKSSIVPPPAKEDNLFFDSVRASFRSTLHITKTPAGTSLRLQSSKSYMGSGVSFARHCFRSRRAL
uniref:Uncharacterized protein n=1 Tax=Anopheles christyi TaxID=43041 RepID=A0A182KIX5_9DIPT